MKKVIALVLAAVMSLSMVACAAAPAAETAAPAAEVAEEAAPAAEAAAPAAEEAAPATGKAYEGTKLKVWVPPFQRDDVDKAFWEGQFAKFEEQTGADVTVEVVSWGDMATKYLTGFMSNDAADVLYMTNEILYDFINQGCLEDLEPYWSEEEIANENFWDPTYYNGKHYMVPFVGGGAYRGYCYNMDILKAAGVEEIPTTWDELLDMCEKVKASNPDVYPFLNPLAGNNNAFLTNMFEFYYQTGGRMINEDNTAYTIDTPEALEAMNFIKTLVDKGYYSTDALGLEDSNVRDLFAEGKVACTVIDNPTVYLGDSTFEWKFSTDLKNPEAASFNPVDTISVNASCQNKQAAVDLVKYMRSNEVIAAFGDEIYKSGQITKDYPNFYDDPQLQDVFSHPERSYALPIAPNLQLVVDSIMKNQQLVVMGTLTPEEALKQIQADADKAMQ